MTIESFKKLCNKDDIYNFLAAATDIWSNDACKGYVIVTLQNLGYPKAQIVAIVNELENSFSDVSVDEAEQLYRKCKI